MVEHPSRLPIADWENFAARRVESVWLAETGAAPENRVFLRIPCCVDRLWATLPAGCLLALGPKI
jgi:hypothetical protein